MVNIGKTNRENIFSLLSDFFFLIISTLMFLYPLVKEWYLTPSFPKKCTNSPYVKRINIISCGSLCPQFYFQMGSN